jgi:hypothetical protein
MCKAITFRGTEDQHACMPICLFKNVAPSSVRSNTPVRTSARKSKSRVAGTDWQQGFSDSQRQEPSSRCGRCVHGCLNSSSMASCRIGAEPFEVFIDRGSHETAPRQWRMPHAFAWAFVSPCSFTFGPCSKQCARCPPETAWRVIRRNCRQNSRVSATQR